MDKEVTMRKWCLFIAAFLLVFVEYASAGEGVRILVSSVKDTRSMDSFFSKCEVELNLMGDKISEADAIRVLNLTTAVDDTGRDLINPEEFPQDMEFKSSGRSGVKKTVELNNPSRRAQEIERLAGTLELYSPSVDKDAVLTIDGFMKRTGSVLENEKLKKAGLSILIMTKDQYDEFRKQQEEEQKKDTSKNDDSEKDDEQLGAIGKAFADLFKGMFGGFGTQMDGNSLKILVEDPESRLVEMKFQDEQGKDLQRNWWSGDRKNRTMAFRDGAARDIFVHREIHGARTL
jgi:hypothetical protein